MTYVNLMSNQLVVFEEGVFKEMLQQMVSVQPPSKISDEKADEIVAKVAASTDEQNNNTELLLVPNRKFRNFSYRFVF